MKRGMLKLTLEEIKKIIGEDIKIIPMMVNNSFCSKCGSVSMKEYNVFVNKKSFEVIISGNCSKCGEKLVRVFDDESGSLKIKAKKLLEEKSDENNGNNIELKREVFQLKIELKGLRPPVWRRFLVTSDITFYDLHNIIQEVMGWENYHMYQFIIGRKSYIVDREDDDVDFFGAEVNLSDKVKIGSVFTKEKQKIDYEYDFGDGWEHRITLEKIVEIEEEKVYPVCIAGKRACPPEDVGGVGGYEYFLKVIKEPEHEDYEEMIQYSGENFDPEEFDIEYTNIMLDRILND